jgi:hypothetical protein
MPLLQNGDESTRRSIMQLTNITYTGPTISDREDLDRLDDEHRAFLERANGVVAFGGGLHVRGVCAEPAWHSLQEAWDGERAYHRYYPEVTDGDVPFAQDAFGDQYLLRSGYVIRMSAEDAAIDELGLRFAEFIDAAAENPREFLSLELLDAFLTEGGVLEPGQLLKITPPACSDEALEGVRVVPVSVREHFAYAANLAHLIRQLPRP